MLRTFTTVGLNFLAGFPHKYLAEIKKVLLFFLAHAVRNAFFLMAKSWQHCLWGHCAVTKKREREREGGRKRGGEREEERQICIYWAVYWLHCNCCRVICSQSEGNVSVVFFSLAFPCGAWQKKKKLNGREKLTARITVKICRKALKTRHKLKNFLNSN